MRPRCSFEDPFRLKVNCVPFGSDFKDGGQSTPRSPSFWKDDRIVPALLTRLIPRPTSSFARSFPLSERRSDNFGVRPYFNVG